MEAELQKLKSAGISTLELETKIADLQAQNARKSLMLKEASSYQQQLQKSVVCLARQSV
jgi:hypothetical protein